MAKTPRTWTGARTPSGLKRVRQAQRRHDILGPRRSAAKTLVAKALATVANPVEGSDPNVAFLEALSALDRAAKAGAIHPNAAARRKSRLTIRVNAAAGDTAVHAVGRPTKQTGKTAAAKAAKARIAAGKSTKAKGAQTAAGKARAALSKTARAEAAAAKAASSSAGADSTGVKTPAKATKAPEKSTTSKAAASKAKSTASKTTGTKSTTAAAKAPAAKSAAKASTARAAPKKKAATTS